MLILTLIGPLINAFLMTAHFSSPSVYPTNWENPRCSMKKDWYIQYYLYAPLQKPKLKILKGMNKFKTWEQRVKATKELLDAEILKLSSSTALSSTNGKQQFSSLEAALMHMVELKRKTCVARHCDNLETTTRRFCKVGRTLGFSLHVQGTTRQTCLYILEHMGETLKRLEEKNFTGFSDKTYNRYVKDLGTLFSDLMYWEYTDYNPFAKMKKRAVIKDLKIVASEQQRSMIDKYIKSKDYCFWRFMHIFFHSGARESELVRMKMTDIHLKERFFIVEIRKGQSKRKEIKAILPEAYRHWAEIIAEGGIYPFGTDFQPGNKPVIVNQVPKLWNRYVKKELKLENIDFYSLKHLHTDLIEQAAGMDLAQAHDDHLQQSTTASIYAVGAKSRKLNALKQLNIKF